MKKLFYILLLTAFIGFVISSCHPSRPCAAYGESRYYQVERPF